MDEIAETDASRPPTPLEATGFGHATAADDAAPEDGTLDDLADVTDRAHPFD